MGDPALHTRACRAPVSRADAGSRASSRSPASALGNDTTGKLSYQPAKFSGLRTEIGDVITYYSPTGGGYGDPLEREPAKVLDDVLDGFITVDYARGDYGVVLTEIDDGYGWTLDKQAKRALRAGLARG